jgi:hypothetical protein
VIVMFVGAKTTSMQSCSHVRTGGSGLLTLTVHVGMLSISWGGMRFPQPLGGLISYNFFLFGGINRKSQICRLRRVFFSSLLMRSNRLLSHRLLPKAHSFQFMHLNACQISYSFFPGVPQNEKYAQLCSLQGSICDLQREAFSNECICIVII